MAPSAQTAGGRRIRRWTRDTIIEKIREWEARYGEPPCSADWNPSLARWRAQEGRLERYREGVWPSTNAVKRPFGGSFDAAVRAAGFVPARPGPRRAALEARPAVDPREPLLPGDLPADAAERVRAAEARVAALERRLAAAERRAERAEAQVGDARRRARRANDQAGRARRARERGRGAERELRGSATDGIERVAVDAEARVRPTSDQAEAAARAAPEARRAARAADARAAEAEARAAMAE